MDGINGIIDMLLDVSTQAINKMEETEKTEYKIMLANHMDQIIEPFKSNNGIDIRWHNECDIEEELKSMKILRITGKMILDASNAPCELVE